MNSSEKIIEVENLVKKFGDFAANDNISFSVGKGEIFGFLGPNGAGKTTAIKILSGLLSPTSGNIKVAGYDVYNESESIKQNIGYMSQKFSLYSDLTIYENIRFYGGIYGLSKQEINQGADYYMQKLKLEKYGKKLVGELPLGWRQKLAFAIAILHKPDIVFLDEPTSGVDPVTRRQFWEMIYEAAEQGITPFVTTHYMDEAEYCERVSIMVDGRIEALGTPGELKERFAAQDINEVFLKIAGEKEEYASN